ncbi:hypothetical protein GGR50DRAFT_553062 [Xylaria sp. CBS 124048]|nr:hypothetical protein GGR50DRAFT_553062 [Xylaria sp. CBS 124048]
MVQEFQLVAPRIERTMWWQGELGDILFDGSGKDLIRLLVIPVKRPRGRSLPLQASSSRGTDVNALPSSSKTPGTDEPGVKGSSDDKARVDSPRPKTTQSSSGAITLSSLPREVHHLIFTFIKSVLDVISLGMTNQYYWSIAGEFVDKYYTAPFGRWVGTSLVCVGDCHEPGDFPPGFHTEEELQALVREKENAYREPPAHDPLTFIRTEGWFPLSGRRLVKVMNDDEPIFEMECSLFAACDRRGLSKDPAFRHIRSQLRRETSTYFPKTEQWILRNLTAKQFVRAEAIALCPGYVQGPDVKVLGFGEVILSRVCWSSSAEVGIADPTNISRGVWAGHCFDITTISRHRAKTKEDEWTDVSEEVSRDIAKIWAATHGENWKQELLDEWPLPPGYNE